MLSVFNNERQLKGTRTTLKADHFAPVDSDLISIKDYDIKLNRTDNLVVEFHVYTTSGERYLSGNHKIDGYTIERNGAREGQGSTTALVVDIYKNLTDLGITRGQYKVDVNTYYDLLGSYTGDKLFVYEISPSRKEVRLRLVNESSKSLEALNALLTRWNKHQTDEDADVFLLNFGFNRTYAIVNMRLDKADADTPAAGTPELVLKLYKELDPVFIEKNTAWVTEEILNSYVDVVNYIPKIDAAAYNKLQGPNFDLFCDTDDISGTNTDYLSWNDLLASNIPTTQKIINKLFSGSLSGVKLNIQYNDFDNFIHFSSAEERVINFRYKLQLIEEFTAKINSLIDLNNTPEISINLNSLYDKRNQIVNNFDDFENYLFFESDQTRLYTYLTGSVSPWPKTTASTTGLTWQDIMVQWEDANTLWSEGTVTDLYQYFDNVLPTTDPNSITYYDNLIEVAQTFDRNNIHRLINTIPEYIRDTNPEYDLFVNMLAQHYDILYLYIKHLTDINTREEHPQDGMANDLLQAVGTSLGFPFINGQAKNELWQYMLGTDADGIPMHGSGSVTPSISGENIAKENWRRLLNNLSYIYKNKGNERAIRAVFYSFGIPQSIIRIKEFGGPSTFTEQGHYPEYVHETYAKAFKKIASGSEAVLDFSLLSSTPDSIEFRYRPDSNFTYNLGTEYPIFTMASGSSASPRLMVTLEKESGDNRQATYRFYGVSGSGNFRHVIGDVDEVFDDDFTHFYVNKNSSGSVSFKFTKSRYGKVTSSSSFSYPESDITKLWTSSSIVKILPITPTSGPGSFTLSTDFLGFLQEVRLWSGSLNNATIEEHTLSPNTYTYNVDRSRSVTGVEALEPYNALLSRFTLSTNIVATGSTSSTIVFPSSHPNQKINTGSVLRFNGYTNISDVNFEGLDEIYHTPSPSLGGNSLYSNKVRIESASLGQRVLNTKRRVEKSSYDKYSIDSNKLEVAFSPQDQINEDIFNQLGYFEIDDYIGDPADDDNEYYPDLKKFADAYWVKYDNKNDFEAFFRALSIYDFTVFSYVKRLIPARVNPIIGLVVEQNVLERPKFRVPKPKIQDLTHTAKIQAPSGSLFADYKDIKGSMTYITSIAMTAQPEYVGHLSNNIEIKSEYNLDTVLGDFDVNDQALIDLELGDMNKIPRTYKTKRTFGLISARSGSGQQYYDFDTDGIVKALQTVVIDQKPADFNKETILSYSTAYDANHLINATSSLITADVEAWYGVGYQNLTYDGCKLTGDGININTSKTTDGGPVVKVTQVNPNQLTFANNQLTTIDQSATGTKTARR